MIVSLSGLQYAPMSGFFDPGTRTGNEMSTRVFRYDFLDLVICAYNPLYGTVCTILTGSHHGNITLVYALCNAVAISHKIEYSSC